MATLQKLRVLQIGSRIASAYCSKLLRGFGAAVEVISAPGEVPAWRSPEEILWYEIGQGLRAFDWQSPGAKPALQALLADTDLLIDARPVGASDAEFGLDAAALLQQHPKLITCRISSFGISGPYRDYQAEDITLYAMSGLMQSTGDGKREPLNSQPKICEQTAGLSAYSACMMALIRRLRDGQGDFIDLSVQEASIENYENAVADHLHAGSVARRNGDEHGMVPWRTYRCADGEATIVGGPTRRWRNAVAKFGDDAFKEPRFLDLEQRLGNRKDFEVLLRGWLADKSRRELLAFGQEAGLAWSYLATVGEALADQQHQARGFFVDATLPDGRKCRMPGRPFVSKLSRWNSDATASVAAAPAPAKSAKESVSGSGPLAGFRVLDFSHDWAGPHAARVFADYGAEVIKIEYPKHLDSMRGGRKKTINGFPRFWQLHRGKHSVTLDLKRKDHLEFAQRLVKDTDLVLENCRAGVMERLGLGYEALRKIKPDIVMVSMSAFGMDGPYSKWAGYGGTIEAFSGLQALTAYDEASPRYRVREVDVLNGIFGLSAALTGLYHRQLTGEGQFIDVSETETTCWLIGEFFAAASASGAEPAVHGNRHPHYAPQGCYACAGEDRWLTISVTSDAQWRALASIIGGEALARDPRYASADDRRAQHDHLDSLIQAWAAQQDRNEAMQQLQRAGVAAGAVFSSRDLANDLHLCERNWVQMAEGVRFPGFPFQMHRGGAKVRSKGPDLGQHNAMFAERNGGLDVGDLLEMENIGTSYDP
ncbi:CoA transferase [Hydrocarboniphaga sp.]|uniref:CaiB/BaiF CoA-transferase family protein n=1 Tax=Hydrocarboniphaga sp. TaxID=2033016 RepID=UPI003D108232